MNRRIGLKQKKCHEMGGMRSATAFRGLWTQRGVIRCFVLMSEISHWENLIIDVGAMSTYAMPMLIMTALESTNNTLST